TCQKVLSWIQSEGQCSAYMIELLNNLKPIFLKTFLWIRKKRLLGFWLPHASMVRPLSEKVSTTGISFELITYCNGLTLQI
ncbi:11282_t:CDS:2, partial [Funneliformis geosporum]